MFVKYTWYFIAEFRLLKRFITNITFDYRHKKEIAVQMGKKKNSHSDYHCQDHGKTASQTQEKTGLSQVIYIIILNTKSDDNSMNENASE